MVELPSQTLTIDAIYKHYETSNGDWRRDHLGASLIGTECERSLWYTFRWASNPNFDGRMLRLFKTGYIEESRVVNDLRSIGIELYDRDPSTGKQIHYSDFGGHFAGSLDAIGIKFPEAPATWHVVELKSSNTKSFQQMRLKGVEITKPSHYFQMQCYMHWSKLERAMYIMVCKETDAIYQERVYYNKEVAERLISKARRIIFSENPSFKISNDMESFGCRYCPHKNVCSGKELPEINCRTCAMATPEENGTWTCGRTENVICSSIQRAGCIGHIFIPSLVPLELINADPEAGTVTYAGDIVNGPGHIESKDLREVIYGKSV